VSANLSIRRQHLPIRKRGRRSLRHPRVSKRLTAHFDLSDGHLRFSPDFQVVHAFDTTRGLQGQKVGKAGLREQRLHVGAVSWARSLGDVLHLLQQIEPIRHNAHPHGMAAPDELNLADASFLRAIKTVRARARSGRSASQALVKAT